MVMFFHPSEPAFCTFFCNFCCIEDFFFQAFGFSVMTDKLIIFLLLQDILEPPECVCEARDKVASSIKAHFPTKRIAKKTKRDSEDLFARLAR